MLTYCAYELIWAKGGAVKCCAEAEPGTLYCPVHRDGVRQLPPVGTLPTPRRRDLDADVLPWAPDDWRPA